MRVSKKAFKIFLGVCAFCAVSAGVCQEFVLSKENNFKRVKADMQLEENDDFISCDELVDYEVVEMRNNDKSELYIARANNFNDCSHKIHYDIFTGKDIVGDNEDSFITSTPIEYYLYGDNIKQEYTKEDLVLLLSDIKENYDYEEVMALKKEM